MKLYFIQILIVFFSTFSLCSQEKEPCYIKFFKEKKFTECKRLASIEAEKGDSVAQFILASVYSATGNNQEALKWYQKAAEKNQMGSLINLGVYFLQCGDVENLNKAEHYLTRASAQGNSCAMSNLASLYIKKKQFKKAEALLLKAIQRGELSAAAQLGHLYVIECPDNNKIEEGIKWWHISKLLIEKDKRMGSLSLRKWIEEDQELKNKISAQQLAKGMSRAEKWLQKNPNYFMNEDERFKSALGF